MNIIGERLRELRLEARYSQQQLAEKCETTQATIGRYENNMAEPPCEKLLWFAEFSVYPWIISSVERIIQKECYIKTMPMLLKRLSQEKTN